MRGGRVGWKQGEPANTGKRTKGATRRSPTHMAFDAPIFPIDTTKHTCKVTMFLVCRVVTREGVGGEVGTRRTHHTQCTTATFHAYLAETTPALQSLQHDAQTPVKGRTELLDLCVRTQNGGGERVVYASEQDALVKHTPKHRHGNAHTLSKWDFSHMTQCKTE